MKKSKKQSQPPQLFCPGTKRIFDFSSFVIHILCLSFVVFKAQECIEKFLDKPETTNVSIEQASKHDYPAISICLNDYDSFYGKTLSKCNLTFDDYFYNNIWVGRNGSHEFCKDPLKLYEEMAKNPFDAMISNITALDDDSGEYPLVNYSTIDSEWNGRCFTFQKPQNTKITYVKIFLWNDAYVYVHSPGSFFGTEYKEFKITKGQKVEIDVMHEVFEVLDFDGHACRKYPFGRDACIFDIIQKDSIEQIGCTSPYGRNKSNICTDQEKSLYAYDLFANVTYKNLTDANNRCPKSCTYQMTSFGSFMKDNATDDPEFPEHGYNLGLTFQRFIKVSKARYSYTVLELLAEVGGYVGLFLGVSLNQILSIVKKVFTLFSSHK